MVEIKARASHDVLFSNNGVDVSKKAGDIFLIPKDQFDKLLERKAVTEMKTSEEPGKIVSRVAPKKSSSNEETGE